MLVLVHVCLFHFDQMSARSLVFQTKLYCSAGPDLVQSDTKTLSCCEQIKTVLESKCVSLALFLHWNHQNGRLCFARALHNCPKEVLRQKPDVNFFRVTPYMEVTSHKNLECCLIRHLHIWFLWSKPSNYQEKLRCHARPWHTNGKTNEQRKVDTRAVFWIESETAIMLFRSEIHIPH